MQNVYVYTRCCNVQVPAPSPYFPASGGQLILRQLNVERRSQGREIYFRPPSLIAVIFLLSLSQMSLASFSHQRPFWDLYSVFLIPGVFCPHLYRFSFPVPCHNSIVLLQIHVVFPSTFPYSLPVCVEKTAPQCCLPGVLEFEI